MATFLTILAVLAALCFTAVVTGFLLIRKAAIKGGVFLLRAGADQALASCNAEWVTPELKEEAQAIHDAAIALPEVGLFNAADVFVQARDLGLRLATFVQRFEESKPKPVQPEDVAPTVLALPAPDATTEPVAGVDGPTCRPTTEPVAGVDYPTCRPAVVDEAPVTPASSDANGGNGSK